MNGPVGSWMAADQVGLPEDDAEDTRSSRCGEYEWLGIEAGDMGNV